MKVFASRKGFTLTEILVVIALIGVLLLFIMPNLSKIFSNSKNGSMKIQESELKDSGILYLEDYCRSPLPNKVCPGSIKRNSDNSYSGYVSLSTLVLEDYIDEISLEETACTGCVIFENSKAKAYISCGESYITDTSVNFKSICNLN